MSKFIIVSKSRKITKAEPDSVLTILSTFVYYLIAVVFVISGISKILNPENFLKVLNITVSFFGENIIILIATLLPVIEIALGMMLVLKIRIKETLIATTILMTIFLIYAIYGTVKGFDTDCGCFGTVIKNEFGFWMIIKNIMLLLLTILIFILILKKEMGQLKPQFKPI